MKSISKPLINQSDIFDAFIELEYKNILVDKSNSYASNFEDLITLYNFEENNIFINNEYKQYMKKMYSERFSVKGYPELYKYYLQIRHSAIYCPYCNFPTHSIKQIDHYFPKSVFPSLSLTVDNLVPICSDCNKTKRNYYSFIKKEMLIHPYFDEFINDSFDFIHCEIIEKEPIGFTFSIKKLDEWDDIMFNRVNLHFNMLELDKLYSSDFETDFSVYIEELKELYKDCTEVSVKEAVNRKIRSYKKSNIKPWYHAGYMSILNNNWFFDFYIKSI